MKVVPWWVCGGRGDVRLYSIATRLQVTGMLHYFDGFLDGYDLCSVEEINHS
jgi:hypothetical protein